MLKSLRGEEEGTGVLGSASKYGVWGMWTVFSTASSDAEDGVKYDEKTADEDESEDAEASSFVSILLKVRVYRRASELK